MEKLHHANIVTGKNCQSFIFEILEKKLDFNAKANPDFLLVNNNFFGIEDVRNFEKWAMNKPLLSEVKVSLIITKSITREAQNALLKILEEPPLGTYIFINLESLGGLAPTFLSRIRILNKPKDDSGDSEIAKKFLSSEIGGKFSLIRSLLKKNDKDEMKDLIKNLEGIAYKSNSKPQDLKNILIAKILASTRGSSPKMLLEWLSCVL